jgi:hypothetical protein
MLPSPSNFDYLLCNFYSFHSLALPSAFRITRPPTQLHARLHRR